MVYNCSNNSIILSGLRTRLSASFTLKSFTPFFLHPLVAVSSSRSLFPPPFLRIISSLRSPFLLLLSAPFSLAVSRPSCGFFLLLPRSDLLSLVLRSPPSSRSIINPSIPSRSFHPHIIKACTHARSSGSTIPTSVHVRARARAHSLESWPHD